MASARSLSVDVLRGTAILLVLIRHLPPMTFLGNMGWAGVDLFFVLSGYLVSGLLFKEYEHHGDIHPVRFLVRRGFKIYPTFYALLPFAAWVSTWRYGFSPVGLFSELTFTQNYLFGFGWWPYTVTWSLAIEEHFYFTLTIGSFIAARRGTITGRAFPRVLLGAMATCLLMRLVSQDLPYYQGPRSLLLFTSTHLRVDALLCGVLIAWMERFRVEQFTAMVRRYAPIMPWAVAGALSFTPFVEPIGSWFVQTIGFTLVYIGFALLLMYVLYIRPVRATVLTRGVGMVGQWSYPIYLSHVFVLAWFYKLPAVETLLGDRLWLKFTLYMALSIALGALISLTWERWFLRMRDARFPSRHI